MSNRPSPSQFEALVEFLEQNPGVAKGVLRTLQGKQECKRKWAELAITLNALGGVSKDGPGWSKYWAEKKCSLKKLRFQYAASIRRTGGQEDERCCLSQLDKRLLAVMGGTSFASGDSKLAIKMSNRPSTLQLEALVEFLEQNPGVARCFLRSTEGKQECKRKWADLAITLNSLGGISKDGPGWSKYWAEKKCSLKKLHSQNTVSLRRTGGVAGERCCLSNLDKRFLAVMEGTGFASNDSKLAHSSVVESHLTSTKVEFSEMDEESVSAPSPTLSTSGTSRAETPADHDAVPPQTSTNTNTSRRRSRRLLSRSIEAEMVRLARIEERRVEVERLSAEALADTSRRLDRLADAAEHIAVAITGVASALQQIANNLGRT